MPPHSRQEYESSDGFNTRVWGPAMWHILHIISFNYNVEPSNEEKLQYYAFLLSLEHVLPCKVCRGNYKKNLKDAGLKVLHKAEDIVRLPELQNRHAFSTFIYKLHTCVCKMDKTKRGLPCTYYSMRKTYETFRAKCVPNTKAGHGGCSRPIDYVASRSVLSVIPQKTNEHVASFSIDNKCTQKQSTSQEQHLHPLPKKKQST